MSRLKAFISSAMNELHNERAACKKALEQYGIDVLWFEGFGARPEPPMEAWLKAVEETDVYIGIFWNQHSAATQQEYEQAVASDKPCFIYEKAFMTDARDQRLTMLLNDIRHRHVINRFATAVELEEKVWRDLHNWLVALAVGDRTRRTTEAITATRASLRESDILEVFEEKPGERVEFERSLLNMMRAANENTYARPFITVTMLPSFITRPWRIQLRRQRRIYRDKTILVQVISCLRERYKIWQKLAKKSEVILLIDKANHERYFAAGRAGQLDFTPDETRQQIERWTYLLHHFPNFVVGLQETPVPTTYILAGSHSLMLYGGTVPGSGEPFTGIRGLRTVHPPTVLRFRLAFEHAWQALPAANKDRETVLEWIKTLLGNAHAASGLQC